MPLVQLEQVVPNWWPTQRELAEQLGIIRSELNANMQELARLGLLGKIARSNTGGTWVYWVKRHAKDFPNENIVPAWVLRDGLRHVSERVHVDKTKEWALWREIPYGTLRSFLSGKQKVMDGRWTLVKTPFDSLIE
jgi:DNA-binding transcriptional MocR family regulator